MFVVVFLLYIFVVVIVLDGSTAGSNFFSCFIHRVCYIDGRFTKEGFKALLEHLNLELRRKAEHCILIPTSASCVQTVYISAQKSERFTVRMQCNRFRSLLINAHFLTFVCCYLYFCFRAKVLFLVCPSEEVH